MARAKHRGKIAQREFEARVRRFARLDAHEAMLYDHRERARRKAQEEAQK